MEEALPTRRILPFPMAIAWAKGTEESLVYMKASVTTKSATVRSDDDDDDFREKTAIEYQVRNLKKKKKKIGK